MERRTFLGTLLAGLGAMVVKPSAGLLWQPSEAAIEIVEPSAFITLNQITMEMLRRITNELQVTVPLRAELSSLIGHVIPDSSLVLNHQYNVGMCAPEQIDRYGLDVERYIDPAAKALAARARGLKGCGALPLPSVPSMQACVMTCRSTGLSLRGLYQYSPLRAEWEPNLRFDILVAQ